MCSMLSCVLHVARCIGNAQVQIARLQARAQFHNAYHSVALPLHLWHDRAGAAPRASVGTTAWQHCQNYAAKDILQHSVRKSSPTPPALHAAPYGKAKLTQYNIHGTVSFVRANIAA